MENNTLKSGNISNESQEGKVLKVLKDNIGRKVSKRYFVQTMMLSQAGRALKNLQDDPKWQDQYKGYEIKSTREEKERDKYNFVYYYLKPKGYLTLF